MGKAKTSAGTGKNLVIVESPAKAKTIEKYLGGDFVVRASFGHVRDLPESSLGIDIENNFEPNYVILKDKKKVISGLLELAKKAPIIYLSPDPDREGEAIAWHLVSALKIPDGKAKRVTFNEITKKAVVAAFDTPTDIDMNRVNSQQARRILDRIVGYKLSPLLWKKLRKQGLSAGRVQSAALRLVCEREREIMAFKAEEYWRIFALLRASAGEFVAELKRKSGKPFKPANQAQADAVLATVKTAQFVISAIIRKTITRRPYPPFATSQLQQAASSQLGFPPKKTMRIAQQLYEGVALGSEGHQGLITYMRTDSFRLSNDALAQSRSYISTAFGGKYLPETPNFYKSRGNAQEAHEAVRPTDCGRAPDSVRSYLDSDQFKLYQLIWRRTLASQMTPAVFDQTTIELDAAEYGWTAGGRVMLFDGYLKVLNSPHWDAKKEDEELGDEADDAENGNGDNEKLDPDGQVLPDVREGETPTCNRIEPRQKFTMPPPRYSEAGLIKELERKGIGRPSTYADIITKIQAREYTTKEKKAFKATALGMIVNDRLVESFPSLMDLTFTNFMEDQLDKIESNEADWLEVLRKFYTQFSENLERASTEMKDARIGEETDKVCPNCGKPMTLHVGRYGAYLWCTDRSKTASEPGDGHCALRVSIDDNGNPVEKAPEPEATAFVCPKCGTPAMIRKVGRFGPYLECVNADCKERVSLDKDGNMKAKKIAAKTNVPCPKCKSIMIIRDSKRGPFLGCSKFPKCRGTRKMIDELKEMFAVVVAAGGTDKVLELPASHPVFTQTDVETSSPEATEKDAKATKAKPSRSKKKKPADDE
ncbi:MAG: type I DNA topoisomerase [Planctomycetota bacterium]